jgi:hypothetical protein
MHKLVDMKINAKERKEKEKPYATPMYPGGDVYPYDLKLSLGDESLEKLGLTDLPKTGKKVRLIAECTVCPGAVLDFEGKGPTWGAFTLRFRLGQ